MQVYMQKLLQKVNLDTLFKYSIGLLLIVIPMYPKFPIFNIPGTYVAVRIEDFIISLLVLLLITYFIKEKNVDLFKDKTTHALVLYTLAGFLSILSAVIVTKTVVSHIAVLHWARRIEYLIPFFVAIVAARTGRDTKFFITTLLLSALVAFLYGLGQIHLHWPVISTQNEEYARGIALRWVPGSRLHSTFSGHYDLAGFLVLAFPIAVSLFFFIKKNIHRIFFALFVICPMFWTFLQTEARVSFVAYLFGVAVTLWFLQRKRYIVPIVLSSLIGMLLLSSLGARYMRTINIYTDKLLNEQIIVQKAYAFEDNRILNQNPAAAPVVEDRSFAIRLNVEWPRAIRAFTKNPLLGTGYSSIGLAADNDYLRLLAEVGIVGALAFLLVLIRIATKMLSYVKNADSWTLERFFVAGFLGSLAAIVTNAVFIDVFEASKIAIIFWTLAGIAYGISTNKNHA